MIDRVPFRKKKKKGCSFSQTIFGKDTWFSKVKLDIETNVMFCNIFIRKCFTYEFVMDELKLSHRTICDWASFCREVCIDWAIKKTAKDIGGPGTIVEIDESKFGKRKYNVGRKIEGQWVFGGTVYVGRQEQSFSNRWRSVTP